jgi:acetyltransferase-like isoleucine patch superfamily enzyme
MTCTSHIITKKKNGHIVLTVKPIVIGPCAVIGAGARIGPGVEIPANAMVPYNAEYRWRYAA